MFCPLFFFLSFFCHFLGNLLHSCSQFIDNGFMKCLNNVFLILSYLPQNGISVKMQGFYSLNKLDGITYESSKSFGDLM